MAALIYVTSQADASVILVTPPVPLDAARPPAPPLELDLNADAIIDLIIPGSNSQINLLPQGINRVVSINQGGTRYAADLAQGSFIGVEPIPGTLWSESPIMSVCFAGGFGNGCLGNFLGGIEYLGIRFDIDGALHYGWLEVESSPFFPMVRIHRWAYESEPGAPILAGRIPEPSVPLLLLSATLLTLRRRRADTPV